MFLAESAMNQSDLSQSATIPSDNDDQKAPTFLQMVGSVMASFYGVQNSKNRKRDFQHGKATHFIAVGILMTAVWYGTIALIVHFVVPK
jgi:hypothetical protein